MCVLVQMLLIQTLFGVLFISECRVNRFRVMVDFVRDPDKFQIL